MDKQKILAKIKAQYPYYRAEKQLEYADQLCRVDENLLKNVEEWANGQSLSDIWIRQKYCVRSVLQLRQDSDFADAVLSLNEYAEDAAREYLIWRQRV